MASLYHHPVVRKPDKDDVEDCARKLGIKLTEEETTAYKDMMGHMMSPYARISDLPDWTPEVKYPRTPGYQPPKDENKYNAWCVKSTIHGANDGILKGKRLAIKDNIAVAGIPIANGSVCMDGTVADIDATVVTRVLDAGGTILGKAVCENLCWTAESFSAASGPVLNPLNPEFSAGGSSSGCAVLIAAGEVDMAIGGDQGGSVRIPSARCGIVGLKPTHGLVPYTGALGAEPNIDHLGPMGKTVQDVAVLLEAIAGYDDGLDPRQAKVEVPEYSKVLNGSLKGARIGMVKEGFAGCDQHVQEIVKEAVLKMKEEGAVVEEISVPVHNKASLLATAVYSNYGFVESNFGQAYGGHGYYPTRLYESARKGLKTHINDASPLSKMNFMVSQYLKDNYGAKYFYKAMNLRPSVLKEYDEVFKKFDILIMPTLSCAYHKLPSDGVTLPELFGSAKACKNMPAYNYTGLPALTLNAGFQDGFPVGMMIVGQRFREDVVLNMAFGIERKLSIS